ncbi:MAG TPA: methyltransferase, partial [Candidatus Deferrimicrobiaceae bacterium]|nr:methyltransferase [Candidatus Deferrimicrobiaceae bacterium]
ADFALPYCGRSALDLGTGSGVVLLLLARRCDALKKGVGVEIQRPLWEFARRNIVENGFEGRLSAVLGDLRKDLPGLSPRSCDLVVSNPPYRKIGEGRRNPDPRKEIARHEVACTMADIFAAAGRYLSRQGRFAVVCPSHRLPETFALGAAAGIVPETVRFVHPYAGSPANRVLVACSRRKAPELTVLPPLVVYSARGRYHPEVEGIFAGFFRGEGG